MNNEFEIRDGTLYKYTGSQETVVIPDSVYRIYEKAFRNCSSVVKIEIPDSVKQIEWGAFSFCPNLEQIIIPSSVSFISVTALEGCTSLKSIIMENNKDYYVKDNNIYSRSDESHIISAEFK